MRFLAIALRLPEAIRFPTGLTPHRSPRVWVTEASYTEKGGIAWYLPYGNYRPTSLPERFVDSLLEGRVNIVHSGKTVHEPSIKLAKGYAF